jgi:hypothetical protein
VSRLVLVPLDLKIANRFVGIEHRHMGPKRGHKFSLGATLNGSLVGVVIVAKATGRWSKRKPPRLEVARLATDGTFNACSFLYQRAKRVVHA